MVLCAAALRTLAFSPQTTFNASLDAHDNNAHALVTLLNQVSAAVFTITAASSEDIQATITDAQSEFLRIASICLLRLGTSQFVALFFV